VIVRINVFLAVLIGSLTPVFAVGQEADRKWESIAQAWDEGDFIASLEGMQQLLSGPDAGRFLDRIALLTGERHQTIAIDPDGRNPRWSPDGRFLAYEAPTDQGTVTRVVRVEGARLMATVSGTRLRFNPASAEVAYIALVRSAELDEQQAEARQRLQPRDRAGFRRLQAEMARIQARHSILRLRDLRTEEETVLHASKIGVFDAFYDPAGKLYFAGYVNDAPGTGDIWAIEDGVTRQVTDGPGVKREPMMLAEGTVLGYTVDGVFVLQTLDTGWKREFPGVESPVASADGRTIAFLASDGGVGVTNLHVIAVADAISNEVQTTPPVVASSTTRLANPALSADGSHVAFQMMVRENWEVFVARVDDGDLVRLTSDDQHDLFPTFLSPSSILVIKGEGRHRRSYVYDLETRRHQRLFHNNTIRTVSPEYTWAVSPDGSMVAIVSERDGDTISPERSLHVVDLGQVLPVGEIEERIGGQLAAERQLRKEGASAFEPIASHVQTVVADVSRTRIYEYERDLFAFGSKFITQPGNGLAIQYIADKLRSFGYEPELQWFEPRPGIRSANIIATLPGTLDPHLVYVISSHFDSVERGPGADDNTSGTTALLEAARVLKDHPMPRTIQFAFFTGEEAGLLGSRHFVREAVANDVQLLGALNNDMVGYANDARLDNTIRYSNAGIRDIQHAAAFLFTDLITYDAKYYKSTDAHAYYEAYGDVVGGIGSYPILANPHYHQAHDVLETINHQLVAEVSKTTVATIMFMASGTARLRSVTADRSGSNVTVAWSEPAESNITNYVVHVWDESGEVEQIQVYKPEDPEFAPRSATLADVSAGATVGVKAWVRGENGVIGSWDWARVQVP